MSRIKIALPKTFIFQTTLSVRINNINYGGHLGHDSVLTLSHEARVRFFDHLGYSELDIEGVAIILGDAAIVYRGEAFYKDILSIDITIENYTRVGCDMFYLIKNKESGKEIAHVKTGIVFFNGMLKKIAPLPLAFKKAVEALKNVT